MKHFNTLPDNSSPTKKGFYFTYEECSSSERNLNMESSYSSRNQPTGLNIEGSLSMRSPSRETITWGINSPCDAYQTTYKNGFTIHGKSDKKRELCYQPQSLSGSLIPLNAVDSKRMKKFGDCNHILSRRVSTEGESFFEKLGERKQPSPDQGRVHLSEPRVQDLALRHAHRFHQQLHDQHGNTHHNLSPSRLAKQILDYCPPRSLVAGEGFAIKNVESLTYTETINHSDEKLANKFGPGYLSVECKIKPAKPQGKRVYNDSASSHQIKELLSNSHSSNKKPAIVKPKREVADETKSSSSQKGNNTYQGIYSKRSKASQAPKRTDSQSKIYIEEEGTLSNRQLSSVNEAQYSSERLQVNRRASTNDKTVMKRTANNLPDVARRSVSRTTCISPSRERSRSNSVKSSVGNFSRKLSTPGLDKSQLEKNQDKNSFLVVSHETKKPTTAGTFTNPMLSKEFVQKKMKAAAMGMTSILKKRQFSQTKF